MLRNITLPNGVMVPYVERGNQSGVPVMLLHGVTDSWRSFEPVLPHLPASIRAFALTLRGHGDASRPETGYHITDMAEDVRAFMDALQLPASIIVGHSMGSMVAQRLAIDGAAKVLGLVLAGSFKSLHGHAGVQEFWDAAVSTLVDPIDPGLVREFQSSTLAQPVPSEFFETVVNESLKVPAAVWRATFRSFLDTPDWSSDPAAIRAPTLIVWGDRDAYSTREDQEALRAAIDSSRLTVYPNAGHALHWEEPERFARDLVAFVYERR